MFLCRVTKVVYKKYIKRNGKLYGPYIYHSRRVNGKVISEYQGTGKNKDYKKFIFIFLGVLILLGAGYGIISNKTNLTGYFVADLDANYQDVEVLRNLEGVLEISLDQGELLPASSKLSFETSKGNYTEYRLKDLLDDESVEGEFYIQGAEISGFGEGYGIIGERKESPLVNFNLSIYSNNTTEEIVGQVSIEEPFIYNLEDNQTAEVVSSSQEVEMSLKGNLITITTDYFEVEEGFGEEYLGGGQKTLQINLSELNLVVEGNVQTSLFYEGQQIVSFGKLVPVEVEVEKEQELPSENVEEEINEKIGEIKVVEKISPLTAEEKQVLMAEFGDEEVQSEVTSYKDRILVRYEYGYLWIENSYDADLSQPELEKQMEEDRIGWLKDIANQFLKEEFSEEILDGFDESYPI